MATTLKIVLGADSLELNGDFTTADAVPVIKEFIRARGEDPTQDQVDALTARAKAANDAQAAAVADNTPS